VTGCPVDFNFLIGDEFVKLATGHAANLGAEAFTAIVSTLPTCNANAVTATLNFDGVSYNPAPRVLAVDSLLSPADGNSTLLIVNRLGGDLMASGASSIGTIFGLLFNDVEVGLSFALPASGCQRKAILSDNFPRTTPPLSKVITQGRTGWMKLWAATDVGLLGAVINFNPSAGSNPSAFNQGHNLHKLTLTTAASLTIPVFAPHC